MTAAPDADPLVALLDRERAALLAAVARVPAARRPDRPAPDRWSALEVAEHVARVDGGVARLLVMKGAEPPRPPEECADARLSPPRAEAVRARAERIEAPERVRPAGGLPEAVVLARMEEARAALVSAYRAADPAVLDGHVWPHPLLGPITLRGWVELAAHHDARHVRQLDELAERLAGRPA